MHARLSTQSHKRLTRFLARHVGSTSTPPPPRALRYSLPRFFLFNAAFILGLGTTTSLLYRSSQSVSSQSVLDEKNFSPFILQSKEPVSPTSSIFTLVPEKPVKGLNPYRELWKGSLWSVQAKQPQLQIARSYTPLPPSNGSTLDSLEDGTLKFLIRQELNGEVSGYLHKLPIGSTLSLRGPNIEFECPRDLNEVVFLAGGTGIAPALQLAHALLDTKRSDTSRPRISLLWANRRRDDCAGGQSTNLKTPSSWSRWFKSAPPEPVPAGPTTHIVEELNRLRNQHKEAFLVDYFVDEENTFINMEALQRHLNATTREINSTERKARKMILVSGPDGFVARFAGPKEWSGGHQVQGKPGGLLKDSGQHGWEVWKL